MSMPNEAPQGAPQNPTPPPAPPQAPYSYGRADDSRRKSPILAACLSCMPGLGQVYVGYYQRGFIHIITVAVIISLLASGDIGPLTPLFALFLGFFWLYNMVDAYRRAALYNQVLAGGGEIEMPEDLRLPSPQGSMAGGITLAAFGALLLAHTRFDLSLDWIGEWWPAALIGLGVYLAVKAYRDQAATKASATDDLD